MSSTPGVLAKLVGTISQSKRFVGIGLFSLPAVAALIITLLAVAFPLPDAD